MRGELMDIFLPLLQRSKVFSLTNSAPMRLCERASLTCLPSPPRRTAVSSEGLHEDAVSKDSRKHSTAFLWGHLSPPSQLREDPRDMFLSDQSLESLLKIITNAIHVI